VTGRSLLARASAWAGRLVVAAVVVIVLGTFARISIGNDARATTAAAAAPAATDRPDGALAVCPDPFLDSDGDGVPDCVDVCPQEPLSAGSTCTCWQAKHHGCPDPYGCTVDGDVDGVPDACDNCPFVPNADQADQDADGVGDACTGLGTIYQSLPAIHDPNASTGNRFGAALATTSAGNGPLLLVGAPFADVDVFPDAGIAYLFDQDATLLGALIKTNPSAGDRLGASLAFRNATPLVGAPFDDAGGVDGGAVYAFTSGAPALLDVPIPPTGAQIGFAIAADDVVVAGAPGDASDGPDAGRVVLTSVGPGGPAPRSVGPANAKAGAQLGVAVAALGNQMFAVGATFARAADVDGAGAVYLLDSVSGMFVTGLHAPSPHSGDLFGFALAPVAGNVLVGAPFDDTAGPDAGAVYVFRLDGTAQGMITAPTPKAGDHFGAAIASLDRVLTASGYAAISAPDAGVQGLTAGIVYVVDADPARATFGRVVQILPNPTPDHADRFGLALAAADPPLGPAGSAALADIIVGAPLEGRDGTDAGLVYRFRFCGTACPAGCGNGVLEGTEECDDGDGVNGDGCDSNCTFTRCGNGVVTSGEACDDGNFVAGDGCSPFCVGEACTGASVTSAAPVASLAAAGDCVESCGCSVDNGKCCDDGDGCTENDTCFASFCRGTPITCDDGVECTIDRCVSDGPSAHHCTNTPQDSLCADTALCTLDVCDPQLGCRNTPIPDCCTTAADCSNGDTCDGDESCIPCVGCDFHYSPCCARGAVCAKGVSPQDGTPCDDHDVCTTDDKCQAEHCAGTDVDCDGGDTCKVYSCDAPSVGCTFAYKSGCTPCPGGDADCLDDNACNGTEHCVAGYCAAGSPPDCDDKDPCTDDVCDRTQGCVNTPTESATVRCLIQAALRSPACSGQPLSTVVTQRLGDATVNVEGAQVSADPRARKRLLRKAQQGFVRARKQLASRSSRRVSAACRTLLRQAIADARRLAADIK
jgi:cysteine-rich repeat protein